MKDFFEGSVSTIGDSEWTEPHDVTAMTHELAAIEVLASHAECHAVELHQEMDVCVRQVNVEGDPLSEWRYFRGKAWAVFRAEARELSPENDEVSRGDGSASQPQEKS